MAGLPISSFWGKSLTISSWLGRALMAGLLCPPFLVAGQPMSAMAAGSTGAVHLLKPRAVNFRDLPAAQPGARVARPFHVPNPAAFARAKTAAQDGTTGRRTGVRMLPANPGPAAAAPAAPAPRTSSGAQLTATTYQGLASLQNVNGLEPPDPFVAVGPTQVVETVNVVMEVYTKAPFAAAAGPRSLDALFGVPAGYNSSDPRVFYDPVSQRWFASEFAADASNNSNVYIAVAADPAGIWSVYTVASNTTQTLYDQPKMAVTSDKAVISWDDYACVSVTSCPYTGAETWVVDKSALIGSSPLSALERALPKLAPPAEGLLPIQPLTATSTAYVAYNQSSDPVAGGQLANPALGLLTITGIVPNLTVTNSLLPLNQGTSVPPNAPQLGSTSTILTNDDRLLNGAWKNNSFWLSANDGCFPAGQTVTASCARFFQVVTPPTGQPYLAQNFDLAAQPGVAIYFPAATFDGNGNLLAVFNESSGAMYPSLLAAVPFPSSTAVTLIQAGTGPYDWKDNCRGDNRWGDYSGAAPDPATGTVWVAGEYSNNAPGATGTALCAWSTAIGQLSLAVPSTTFYFAEGFTGAGYTETLSLLIPNYNGTAQITYDVVGGSPIVKPPRSLTAGQVWTENVNNDVPVGSAVSAQVVLSAPGTVERTIHFNDPSQLRRGSTDKVGAPGPAMQWNFAEGSTLSAYREYLTLQNPGNTPANVTLNYFLESSGITAPVVKTLTLLANSRTTVEVFGGDTSGTVAAPVPCVPGAGGTCGVGPGIGGVSVQVASNTPIVVERPFYVHNFSFGSGAIEDGHDAFGATASAPTWYFAEGSTLNGFNEFLTLQNPNPGSVTVDLHYATDDVNVHPTKTLTLAPTSRTTVVVYGGDTAPGPCNAGAGGNCGVGPGITGVSVAIVANGNIVAERPMYMVENFGSGPVAGAHVAVGATGLSELFGFAWGSTLSGDNDYLTIQNPGPAPADVAITYYATAGGQTRVFTRQTTVTANTRQTVLVFENDGLGAGPGYTPLGIVVQADQRILAEKPTYSANPATYGATDTLGYVPPAGF